MAQDRFDLEAAIMAAWGTSDDLELAAEDILESDAGYDVDKVVNTLVGLKELHDMRLRKLWGIFEALITAGVFTRAGEEVRHG
jgi:hypothetical protein